MHQLIRLNPMWQVPVDSDGKQMGFDIIAVRMLERLETMVSGHRRDHGRPRQQPRAVTCRVLVPSFF